MVLRRVLRRGSEKGVSRRGSEKGVSRRGSEKGVSRRYPERPLREYRHIRNYYLSNSKAFQDGNGNFRKITSNDFQDGNWQSMEMKG